MNILCYVCDVDKANGKLVHSNIYILINVINKKEQTPRKWKKK